MGTGESAEKREKVLFLCTHNSARSQMAEGILRSLGGDRFEAYSAGTEATFVRPEAVTVMTESDVDLSEAESKTLEGYVDENFAYVITVCDDANESCPVFPGAINRLHWSFPDPSKASGTEEDRLKIYRRVRDDIRDRVSEELLS